MKNSNPIQKVDLGDFRLYKILADIKKNGKPYIITDEGRGVAAILPYIDPDEIKTRKIPTI